MKLIFAFVLLLSAQRTLCQIYFDDTLHQVPKKNATIKATGIMKNGLYEVTGYTIKRKSTLACFLHYTDSTMKIREGAWQQWVDGNLSEQGMYHNNHRNGLWVDYTKEGYSSDSTIFKDDHATIKESFFYNYNTGNLMAATLDDVDNNKFYYTTYAADGAATVSDSVSMDYSSISFTPDHETQYYGGPTAWMQRITHAMMPKINAMMAKINDFNKNNFGTALIRFVIDTTGTISHVISLTMEGTEYANLCMEIISRSPAWIPAEKDGHKVASIRIQPFTLETPDN